MSLNLKKALEFVGYHRPEYEKTLADLYYQKMEDEAMEPVSFDAPFKITLGLDHGHTTDEGAQGWWKPNDDDGNDEYSNIIYFSKYKNGKPIEWRSVDKENGGKSEKYDENGKIIEVTTYYPSQKIQSIRFNNRDSKPNEVNKIEYYPTGRVNSETFIDEDGDEIVLNYLDHDNKYLSGKSVYGLAKPKGGNELIGKVRYLKYKVFYYAQTDNPIQTITDDIHSGIRTTTDYDREGNVTNRKEEESKYKPLENPIE